jgi:hypothetical protein
MFVYNVTNGNKKLSLVCPYDNISQKNCHSVRTGDRQVPAPSGVCPRKENVTCPYTLFKRDSLSEGSYRSEAS